MSSSSDPAERLRAHYRRERGTIDRHPSPEQIVAYHERRLSSEEAEEVRAHLAACADCTAQLLMLADLLDEGDEPGSEIPPAQLDAAWQRQRARLFPAPAMVSLETRKSRRPSPRWAWTTAASLGLAAALLAVMVVDQRRIIERLSQPQVNPPLVNLAPVDATRQGGGEAPELRFPANAEWTWVILNPVEELDSPTYDVEIVAPDGEVVLRLPDLSSSEAGNFRFGVPPGVLRAGEHRIRLFGKEAGQRRAAGEFALRVLTPAQSSP
ncbi:MAG TPA: zf-HC2 domain-containing protein [Thermoanaerobaculia bacterium]|nr:zf-HC2 domain-containing protein [Thermoanaerobaculia bacterium]